MVVTDSVVGGTVVTGAVVGGTKGVISPKVRVLDEPSRVKPRGSRGFAIL